MEVCSNRKAHYEYHVLDTIEAGLVLQGTEVKALRDHRASLEGSYAVVRDGELWLIGSHIEEYSHGNVHNHNPKRERKLLLKRHEIRKFAEKAGVKGHTLVPLKIYFNNGKAKIQLAVAQGKKSHDKRESIKERDQQREMRSY